MLHNDYMFIFLKEMFKPPEAPTLIIVVPPQVFKVCRGQLDIEEMAKLEFIKEVSYSQNAPMYL